MKDKEIRKILIEYIKATANNKVRIYEEKNIGNSICDVMAVSNEIIGYEIKSDSDTYTRLSHQIKSYDSFFDRNYIVVSSSHRQSVEKNVPDNWGILVIEKQAITLVREAKIKIDYYTKFSYTFKLIKRLNMLFDIELRNILTKHNLPSCVYKSKEYIINKLILGVDKTKLSQDIIYELLNREDFKVDLDFNLNSFDCNITNNLDVKGIINTLSELNLDKFTLDQWIMLYRKAKSIKEIKNKDIKKLDNQREHDIKIEDIEFRLGSPWISKTIINEFDYFLRYGEDLNDTYCDSVHYEPITGNWNIINKTEGDYNRLCVLYGIEEYNAIKILEATLNMRDINIYKENNTLDEEKIIVALEQQTKIEKLFKDWVLKDEDRVWEIEERYNNTFGEYKPINMDGSKLEFPNMSKNIKLYQYQKDAIKRIVHEKNTLLAHDVGAGKTLIMIAAAMLKRQMGISRKNMFVVPNNIVGQWEIIFKTMYPNSKVLAISPSNYKKEVREKVLRQIIDGDYDGIIIAYSCFEMIPLSKQKIIGITEDEINRLKEISEDFVSIKDREIKYIKNLINHLDYILEKDSSGITFEDLEITGLYVDEAHNFKNIPIRTSFKGGSGINKKGSNKCYEMLLKIRSVQRERNGGVVLATGTPICNSITDVYNMQMYLQYDELKKTHLDRFDNWLKTFAKVENVAEVDVDTSKYRIITKISKFYNLPELSRMFSKVADFHAVNMKDELPINEGYHDVLIKQSKELKDYMISLSERTDKIRAIEVSNKEDNMLKISTDGRKAALDLRLVGLNQSYDNTSKIYKCVNKVLQIYNKYVDSTQIIFCDYSTPKANAFNVYDEIKNQLIKQGVNREEIAFIHDYTLESEKVRLFKKFNEGKVRILIGSTFKLGTGSNVQNKLKAIHHLDVPWRPSDMVQREGRIIRKGNKNKYVKIYRYLCRGSFDAYAWQILESKQKFISQFLSGTTYQRSIEDLENNVLNYAEVKALTIGNQKMKLLFEKSNELEKYRILSKDMEERAEKRRLEFLEAKSNLFILIRKIKNTKENMQYISTINSIHIKDEVKKLCNLLKNGELFKNNSKTTSLLEFNVEIPEVQDKNEPSILLNRNDVSYEVKLGTNIDGNIRRIMNVILHLDKVLSKYEKEYEECYKNYNNYLMLLENPNTYEGKIFKLEREITEISNQLLDETEDEICYTEDGSLMRVSQKELKNSLKKQMQRS